jgi:hypothetical protein
MKRTNYEEVARGLGAIGARLARGDDAATAELSMEDRLRGVLAQSRAERRPVDFIFEFIRTFLKYKKI